MTHIKKIKIYQFCVCEEIHDKTSWNWGSYWNCVLLEVLSVLSILCSSHFVQGLQVRGECKIISQKWEASERRVWSPSVHQQAASMCVQNTTFQHIVSRLHALLGPSVSSPWHQSQHNHLTVRSTFFFSHKSVGLQPFLRLSSEPILPQPASSWQSATISFPVLRCSIALVPYIHLSFLIPDSLLKQCNGKHRACYK